MRPTAPKAPYHAESIRGWMLVEELDWLFLQSQQHLVVVEVGVWCGRSTHALALAKVKSHRAGGVVFTIDSWQGSHNEILPGGPQEEARDGGGLKLKMEAKANLQQFIDLGCLFLIESKSDAARMNLAPLLFQERKADMLWVDACHEYLDVLDDLNWSDYVRPGGLLCGHDREFPGVKRAVSERFPGYTSGPGGIWWYKMPEA